MAERLLKHSRPIFKGFKMIINQYKSGWDSLLKDQKRELSSAVSEPVVLTGHLKVLSSSLGYETSLGGQAEIESTDAADIKSPRADDPASLEVTSPGADDTAVEDPEIKKPDAAAPGAHNKHILKLV